MNNQPGYILFVREYRVFAWMLFIPLAMIILMAAVSSTIYRIHPDEFDHINAAKFYRNNWLPPQVADPRTFDSYSYCGMSYLNEWDVVYFFSGKFAKVVHPFIPSEVYTFRIFNICLFLFLTIFALVKKEGALVFAILLISPQIWYLFSYFNGDAFPLFFSILAAYELVSPSSRFNSKGSSAVSRYLLLAIYIGLIILSKRTFWIFGLFCVCYAALAEISSMGPGNVRTLFRRIGILAGIILAIILPRISYDLYINGTPQEKADKIITTADRLANPGFKPGDILANPISLSKLKEKGVSLSEILRPWLRTSLRTSFGGYAYMTDYAGAWFYNIIITCFGIFLLLLGIGTIQHGGIFDKVILLLSILSCLIIADLSLYFSWTTDYEPQGRYLFGCIAIIGIVLARSRPWLKPAVVHFFIITCFLLSTYSFIFIGLDKAVKTWERFDKDIPQKIFIRNGIGR